MTNAWFAPDAPIVFHTNSWQQGWLAERVDDHWEVYYTPTERMRIGADGSLQFGGQPEYIFQTQEWAQLCADRLNSLDAAFGRGPNCMFIDTSGSLLIGATSPKLKLTTVFRTSDKTLFVMDEKGAIIVFDIPQMILLWWKTTAVYKALKRLWYGERGWHD